MYLTLQDQVSLMLQANQNPSSGDVLLDVINSDKSSTEKQYMRTASKYYAMEQDILLKDFNKVIIDGITTINPLMSNDKLMHGFHRILIDQKIAYCASKPVKFATKDENVANLINSILPAKFDLINYEWGIQASNQGDSYLHPYIDTNGNFRTVIIPSEQIIPVYDSTYQQDLIAIIRYYEVITKATRTTPEMITVKVECYNSTNVWYFEIDKQGKLIPDTSKQINPAPHFTKVTTINNNITGFSWGKPPFVRLKNNLLSMSDLKLYKTLVDSYDESRSQFSNNLKDIQELFWTLTGADQTDLGEFVRNLKTYKAMKIPAGAEVDAKSGEMPFNARKEHEDKIWEDIFFFGMGVNWKSDTFRNPPSGTALKTLLIPLDLKSNALITQWNYALLDLLYFVNEYSKIVMKKTFDYESIPIVFNKSLIVNDTELINQLMSSKGTISDQTILENHPLVKDSKEEAKRIEEQRKKELETYNLENYSTGADDVIN